MNILYLVHRIPYPPNKGDKLRSFRFLEHLSKRHRVWCACYVDDPSDMQYVHALKAICDDVIAIPLNKHRAILRGLWGLLRGKTVTEYYYRTEEMKKALIKWSIHLKFDVAIAFSSSMVRYVYRVPAKRRVLDLCDLDSQKWHEYADHSIAPLKWIYRLEGRRLATKEQWWAHASDATIVITDAEATDLRRFVLEGKLHVVTNGVDIPSTHENIEQEEKEASSDPSSQHPVIGFVGVMDYRPNVDAVRWFVENCWVDICQAYPKCEFRIVGRNPSRAVKKLTDVPGVTVVGEVKDVSNELNKFTLSVAPMRMARGLQNKVLEAMAAEIPVVLSSKAARGINGKNGETYLVADSPDHLIRCVSRLLSDPDLCKHIGESGHRFVSLHHNWIESLRKYELIATGVIDKHLSTTFVNQTLVPSAKTVIIDPQAAETH